MRSMRILIVGLGNYNLPKTRHSIGQLTLESLNEFLKGIDTLNLKNEMKKTTKKIEIRSRNEAEKNFFKNFKRGEGSSTSELKRSDGGGSSRIGLNYSRKDSGWRSIHVFRNLVEMNFDEPGRSIEGIGSSDPEQFRKRDCDGDSEEGSRLRGGLSKVSIELFKPKSLMNISGPPILRMYRNLSYHNDHENYQTINTLDDGEEGVRVPHHDHPEIQNRLIILSDELDLKPLRTKLRIPPGSLKPNGHNGLRSVFDSLSRSKDISKDHIYSIKIGIGRKRDHNLNYSSYDDDERNGKGKAHYEEEIDVSEWVLGKLSLDEIRACSWKFDHLNSNDHHHGDGVVDRLDGRIVLEVWRDVLRVISL